MNDSRLWGIALVVALVVIPLQVFVLPALLTTVWTPHLGILAVFLFALRYGEGVGVVVGLVLGLLFDRFSAGDIGPHMLILPLVGVSVAIVCRLMPQMGFTHHLMLLTLVAVVGELSGMFLFQLAGNLVVDGWLIQHRLLPALVADIVGGGLLLGLVSLSRDPMLN